MTYAHDFTGGGPESGDFALLQGALPSTQPCSGDIHVMELALKPFGTAVAGAALTRGRVAALLSVRLPGLAPAAAVGAAPARASAPRSAAIAPLRVT
ncbi:MAG: hypothetical protein ACLPQS_12205 [Acidimicrobiales bacterium]